MKSYKSIIASALFAGLALTTTSCIGDLDLEPNDPNTTTAGNMTEAAYEAVLAKCYSGLAVSGQGETLTGPDGNTYTNNFGIKGLYFDSVLDGTIAIDYEKKTVKVGIMFDCREGQPTGNDKYIPSSLLVL